MNDKSKNIKKLETNYNECNIHGICTISPALAAEKSTMLALLQELAFFIQQVRGVGAKNDKIKNDFFYIFSVFTTNFEFSDENLRKIICIIRKDIIDTKAFYKKLCDDKCINFSFYKSRIKLLPDFKMIDVIKQGQKVEAFWKKNISENQRKTIEIILLVLKSICMYINELQSVDYDTDKYYLEIINALAQKNLHNLPEEHLDDYLNKLISIDNELMHNVCEMRKKEFGDFIENNILVSAKEGKAILVAGANLKELQLILEATKNTGINVYTHGQLIAAHTYSKLKKYTNLAGHYGQGTEFYMSDFASFPGVIYLTNLFPFKVNSLYSSRIFTGAQIPPQNTTSIVDKNFDPLIHAAISTKGFKKQAKEEFLKIGLVEKDYYEKLDIVKNKVISGEIKNIFTGGITNKLQVQTDYFKRFLGLLKEDSYFISFYYGKKASNTLYANIDYAFPFLHKILNELLPLKEKYDLKLSILFTRCEPHTIPNIIYIKNLGIHNIYFHQCSPLLVNPATIEYLLKKYDIKEYTTPENDLQNMLK